MDLDIVLQGNLTHNPKIGISAPLEGKDRTEDNIGFYSLIGRFNNIHYIYIRYTLIVWHRKRSR